MARAVDDFQSLSKKTAIGKRREAMSKEIMQFDDAMFESKLNAMIKTKVEDIVNAMPDASGRRDREHRQIRAQDRSEGVPGRSLQARTDGQGRQARA